MLLHTVESHAGGLAEPGWACWNPKMGALLLNYDKASGARTLFSTTVARYRHVSRFRYLDLGRILDPILFHIELLSNMNSAISRRLASSPCHSLWFVPVRHSSRQAAGGENQGQLNSKIRKGEDKGQI